ncbi:MAG: guanylate kinase [Patescibacteria group bacterium]|nr:guanylate kinase [Patescibacteria group bacterium]
MNQNKVIIIAAPSGSGKSTIAQSLLANIPEIAFSISATTRSPRAGEKNGREYYFFTTEEFKKKIEAGDFFEWEEVYPDKIYGTLKSEMARIFADNKAILFDVDVVGGLNIKAKLGDQALAIFIAPPSLDELKERLISRNTDTEEAIRTRLEKAKQELEYKSKYDYVVINDNLDQACLEVNSLVKNFLK